MITNLIINELINLPIKPTDFWLTSNDIKNLNIPSSCKIKFYNKFNYYMS